jgi:beta-fructofuranosidase
MLWSPSNFVMGDIDIVVVDGRYHLFSEATSLLPGAKPGPRYVIHAVSDNLVDWQELPVALEAGPAGSPDALYIFHLNVLVHEGTWYMFYTGLDVPPPGQQQTIMLATSRDGITWTKREDLNPVLRADPRWYEPSIPRSATYQEKDFGRLWFRDPFVVRDPQTGRWCMIVIARDLMRHVDDRGCIAWAESEDLIHWEAHPPIFSPGRFHTVETPSLFEHNGWWYLVYMTHPSWGLPPRTTDAYVHAGDFYAVSKHGIRGPYEPLSDEIIVGSASQMRFAAQKTVVGLDGRRYVYGWLNATAANEPARTLPSRKPMPLPKPVEFLPDGRLRVMYNPLAERRAAVLADPSRPITLAGADAARWRCEAGVAHAKAFHQRSAALTDLDAGDFIVSATVRLERGSRAGLVFRTDRATGAGLQVIADAQRKTIEIGVNDAPAWLDCRGVPVEHEFKLTVLATSVSLEVYYNDSLVLHQVRHTEQHGAIGFVVDRAQATFRDLRVLALPTTQQTLDAQQAAAVASTKTNVD